jgi:drug/metabolite transporter (DMT)-like permease
MAAPPRGHAVSGIAMVLAGAVLLSAKGVVAKLMYAAGGDAVTVSAIRAVLAVPGFWTYAIWRMGARRLLGIDRRSMLIAALIGLLSYYGGSLVNFYALTLIDASLERMLLFTYPMLVVVALALLHRRWPSRRVLTAMTLTYVGVVLAVGALDGELLRANWYGSLLVLLSAAGVAAYYIVNARVSAQIGSQAFTVYAMSAAGIGMGVHLALTRTPAQVAALPMQFWWLMAFMVVAVTVLPLFLMAEGVARVGAARGSLISAIGPASTVFIAWRVLDERLSLVQIAGSALIVSGILVLESRRSRPGG